MHHTITLPDPGSEITLQRGDTLTVQLDENPSTGHAWTILGFAPGLDATGDRFTAPDTDALGVPGVRELSFHATTPGDIRQRFALTSPREDTATEVRTLHVVISI